MARTRVVINEDGLDRLSTEVEAHLVRPITEEVAADMRRYVPVLSGDLRDTIEVEHRDGEGRVYFGDPARGVDYHLYQEFGTSKMAAQPYARPALYKQRGA